MDGTRNRSFIQVVGFTAIMQIHKRMLHPYSSLWLYCDHVSWVQSIPTYQKPKTGMKTRIVQETVSWSSCGIHLNNVELWIIIHNRS